jgi:putative ABC transport system permease protein
MTLTGISSGSASPFGADQPARVYFPGVPIRWTLAVSILLVPLAGIPAQVVSISGDTALSIAIERRFADAAHLHVGDTVRLSTSTVAVAKLARVAAIYEPRPDPSTLMRRDYHVRLHLADLALLLGQPDRVDRIGVVLQPGIDPDSAAVRLNRSAFGYDVFPSGTIAAQSSTTFVVVSRFHRAIAIISVLASTVFLLCLMLLKVEARRRDVAVLRFTGISRRTVFVALALEAAVVALFGSMLGVGIAVLASTAVNSYYQRAFDTALVFSEFTTGTVLLAVGLSLALGFGAGALAAWRLVRTAPVELWSRAA